jgi:hypothetical protein
MADMQFVGTPTDDSTSSAETYDRLTDRQKQAYKMLSAYVRTWRT